jgi:hypothetical protein
VSDHIGCFGVADSVARAKMARELGRLTAFQVKRAKPGWHHDGGGLYLKVDDSGSYWTFRYGAGGKKYHGLGPAHTLKLSGARAGGRLPDALGRRPRSARRARGHSRRRPSRSRQAS